MKIDFAVSLPLLIQLLISTVLPLLVGLVTKLITSPGLKAVLLAGLAIITSGLTELLASILNDSVFNFGLWLVAAIGSFAVAVAVHYGLWKPTGVTTKVQLVGDTKRGPAAETPMRAKE